MVYYLHGDHLGSTSLTTDQSGAVVAQTRYLPYGQERWTSGATPTDFTFTGQRNEAGFGLMDYNARYYSQALGRFISPDTIVPGPGNSQALNRYAYTFNNPLRYTDSSGHCPSCKRLDDVGGGGLGQLAEPVAKAAVIVTLGTGATVVGYQLGQGINETFGQQPGTTVNSSNIPTTEEGLTSGPAGPTVLENPLQETLWPSYNGGTSLERPRELGNGLLEARGRTKTDRLKEHLTDRDLDAARREGRGEVVKLKSSGIPWNHRHEVSDAQRGLLNRIEKLKILLSDPKLPDTDRQTLQKELSEASKLLDHSEGFMSR